MESRNTSFHLHYLGYYLFCPDRRVSYAGSSGSDTMPMICDLHFVKIFIRVCNLEKVTFEQKYSVHLSRYGPCKANLHSQMYEGKALCI